MAKKKSKKEAPKLPASTLKVVNAEGKALASAAKKNVAVLNHAAVAIATISSLAHTAEAVRVALRDSMKAAGAPKTQVESYPGQVVRVALALQDNKCKTLDELGEKKKAAPSVPSLDKALRVKSTAKRESGGKESMRKIACGDTPTDLAEFAIGQMLDGNDLQAIKKIIEFATAAGEAVAMNLAAGQKDAKPVVKRKKAKAKTA